MSNESRIERNQKRRTSTMKGTYPPSTHTHYSFDNSLDITGELTIDDNVVIDGDLTVSGNANIAGGLIVNSKPVSTLNINDVLIYENELLCYENKILVWEL